MASVNKIDASKNYNFAKAVILIAGEQPAFVNEDNNINYTSIITAWNTRVASRFLIGPTTTWEYPGYTAPV